MKTNVIEIISAEDYLAFERNAEQKHEYFNGIIIEMAGASYVRTLISRNLVTYLTLHTLRFEYQAVANELKVFRAEPPGFYYPDAVVVCEPPKWLDEKNDVLLNPCVIFEVLSPSTEKFDRNEKFNAYIQIESLTDYILVAQNKIQVERFTKTENNVWRPEIYTKPNDRLEFEFSFITLKEIYYRTDLK